MSRLPVPRPFLKWAGGKTKLVEHLMQRRPPTFRTYHEPFLGSGALFFSLYRENLIRHAFLSDINAELIDTYIAIRDHVKEVIEILSEYRYSQEFYYELREKDPWKLRIPERAARMIYLNKTGYNGLYRVNQQGKYNVPFGRYKAPRFLDPENLLAVSKALRNVEIICSSFERVLDRVEPEDWVYFDPPYFPISSTANFTSYQPDRFGFQEHEQLRNICLTLTLRGAYITVSNSNTSVVRSLYSGPCFSIEEISVHRAISCKGSERKRVTELIIRNYCENKVPQPYLFEA